MSCIQLVRLMAAARAATTGAPTDVASAVITAVPPTEPHALYRSFLTSNEYLTIIEKDIVPHASYVHMVGQLGPIPAMVMPLLMTLVSELQSTDSSAGVAESFGDCRAMRLPTTGAVAIMQPRIAGVSALIAASMDDQSLIDPAAIAMHSLVKEATYAHSTNSKSAYERFLIDVLTQTQLRIALAMRLPRAYRLLYWGAMAGVAQHVLAKLSLAALITYVPRVGKPPKRTFLTVPLPTAPLTARQRMGRAARDGFVWPTATESVVEVTLPSDASKFLLRLSTEFSVLSKLIGKVRRTDTDPKLASGLVELRVWVMDMYSVIVAVPRTMEGLETVDFSPVLASLETIIKITDDAPWNVATKPALVRRLRHAYESLCGQLRLASVSR